MKKKSDSQDKSENNTTIQNDYEISMPKVFEEAIASQPKVATPRVFMNNNEIETQELENPTLRKVEVLSNLANACKNKEVIKAISALPDGKVILNIFITAIQQKIDQIMTGQMESQVMAAIDQIKNNINNISDSMISVNNLAIKMQEFFVHLHKSPLVDVLKSLSENLNNMPKTNSNPYFQAQAGVTPGSSSINQVSPIYESQIEQTPKFTKQRAETNPAPTAPPRDSGILSW
jgi:hypothetical protein